LRKTGRLHTPGKRSVFSFNRCLVVQFADNSENDGGAMADDGPKKLVIAEEFQLVDKEGRKRAILGFKDTMLRFALYDESDVPRAAMYLDEGASCVVLYDGEGRGRILLGVRESGDYHIQLMDEKGNVETHLAPIPLTSE